MAARMKKRGPAKGEKAAAEKEAAHRPGAFLDLPPAACRYESASVVVLPMPFEETVSYGGGTAAGPAAIIEASQQVELYDHVRDGEPALLYGIHTLRVPEALRSGAKAEAAVAAIAVEAARHLEAGKFVVGLGGEHTVSYGLAKAVAGTNGAFTLVHIDAHADLRDEYQGDPYSHACVVRRIAELPECEAVLQLGIRSTSADQMEYARAHARPAGPRPWIRTWFSDDIVGAGGWKKEFRKSVKGRRVLFTFDVDGLDPSLVPATGTPEPDGLGWRHLMKAAELVADNAEACIAMDCVELAPSPGLHYAEFTIAKALYRMISMFMRT